MNEEHEELTLWFWFALFLRRFLSAIAARVGAVAVAAFAAVL